MNLISTFYGEILKTLKLIILNKSGPMVREGGMRAYARTNEQ